MEINNNSIQFEQQDRPLQVSEVSTQVNMIKEAMTSLMKSGIHFGRIPGKSSKPTLLKPGAEKILNLFRIAVKPVVTDLSTGNEIRYRVLCKGYYPSNKFAGGGVGECSSNEEKFKWRKAVCDQEYELFPEDMKRIKFYRDRNDADSYAEIKQVRIEAADQANTVLKIAKKRALIDMCLTVAAVSDIFTQDLEDYVYSNDTIPPTTETVVPDFSSQPAIPDIEGTEDGDSNNLTIITDQIKKVSSKALQNGKTKWGVLTAEHDWFSTFNSDHAQIAEFAQAENYFVTIDFAINGAFKNIRGIELIEKSA